MRLTLLIGTVFLWGIAHFACSTIEGGTTGADMSTYFNVLSIDWAQINSPIEWIATVAFLPFAFIWGLLKMLLFLNYGTIFQGDYVWIRTLFLWPLSIGLVYGLVMNLRGTSSA